MIEFPDMPPIRNGQTIVINTTMLLDGTGWHTLGPITWRLEDPDEPDQRPHPDP